MEPPNFYKPTTCFALVKKDCPKFYKAATRFGVVKTVFYMICGNQNGLCEHLQAFAVVNTASPKSYEAATCSAEVKMDSLKFKTDSITH